MITKATILPLLCLFLLPPPNVFSQRSEVGFGLGTLNYTGDLVRSYDFSFSKPAGTIFYRTNLSNALSFRTGLTAGKLGARDRAKDLFSVQRAASFNLFLFEVSTVFEYHFLNWRDRKQFLRFTPYMFLGMGVFGMAGNAQKSAEFSNIQSALPFGLGFKYVLNPKWYVSLEFGARKTFFDFLDNVSDRYPRKKNYQYGNPFDDDHYFYLGLSLTRTFYNIPCPASPYK